MKAYLLDYAFTRESSRLGLGGDREEKGAGGQEWRGIDACRAIRVSVSVLCS